MPTEFSPALVSCKQPRALQAGAGDKRRSLCPAAPGRRAVWAPAHSLSCIQHLQAGSTLIFTFEGKAGAQGCFPSPWLSWAQRMELQSGGCWGLLVWAEREPWEMVDRESGPRPQITKITTVIRIVITYKVLTICLMLDKSFPCISVSVLSLVLQGRCVIVLQGRRQRQRKVSSLSKVTQLVSGEPGWPAEHLSLGDSKAQCLQGTGRLMSEAW